MSKRHIITADEIVTGPLLVRLASSSDGPKRLECHVTIATDGAPTAIFVVSNRGNDVGTFTALQPAIECYNQF